MVGGGTPSSHGGGVPHPVQTWPGGIPGTPPSRPGWATPHHQDLARVSPLHQDLAGVPLTIKTWLGYPPPTIQTWLGYPTPSRPDWGSPPTIQTWLGYLRPPSRCGLTNKLKTVPSPILRMRVVITKLGPKWKWLVI